MSSRESIRRAQSCADDPREAVREFRAAVDQPHMSLVVFFCSSDYDLNAIAGEMKRLFADVPVVGCTTAGEIGPAGYTEHSLAGASFAAESFTATCARMDHVRGFTIARGQAFVQQVLRDLDAASPHARPDNTFALMLIDGLSVREEPVTRAFQRALGRRPLIGGSAGDGLRFGATHVYLDGAFHADSLILTLASTDLPFSPFMTEHFVASEQRVVVTEADVEHRIVREIDGLPAATAYAALTGTDLANLDPMRFATSPMVVRIGDDNYVRSISNVTADGSLEFFCAIDEGMVLRVAHGGDLVDDLRKTLHAIRDKVGEPQLVIGCDCVLRRLEVLAKGQADAVADAMRSSNVVGFCSYGEQYHGVHLNQTFTGIAIGHHGAGTEH